MLIDHALRPLGRSATIGRHVVTESLDVLKSAGCEPRLNDLYPSADPVDFFPYFLPFQDPSAIDLILGT